MRKSKFVLMGLPATGKTTFLAALWHALESREIECALTVTELVGVRDYLNEIRDLWLQLLPIERTKLTRPRTVSMLVAARAAPPTQAELTFQDLSGESFELQWTHRKCEKSFVELASASSGAILFLHANKLVRPTRIDAANAMAAEIRGTATGTLPVPSPVVPQKPWSPSQSPTQVILADLVQTLLTLTAERRGYRLAVVVSAWDLVAHAHASPADWLEREVPLLHQLLESLRADGLQLACYGVSAQGGDLKHDAQKLQDVINPTERVVVVGPSGRSSDITEPVHWLMGD